MTALLALLLASADIERIELPAGGFARPGEWTVAVVHVRSAEAFHGFVEIETDAGVSFRAPLSLSPGGAKAVTLPFVSLGQRRPQAALRSEARELARRDFPDDWRLIDDAQLLVGVVPGAEGAPASLPAVWTLDDGRRACLFAIEPKTDDSWLLESVDVLAGAWGGAAGAWRASGGEHWTDAKELRSRLAGVERRTKSRLRLVDEAAWRLAPSAAWPEGRRNFLVLFSVVYAFAAFVALFWVARRGGRATLAASVAGLGILFAALGWLMFPGGRISIVAHRFDYLNSDGSGATAELIFATALSPRDAELTFTRRVRPVFPDPRSAATAGVILEFATGGAVTVRGWDPEIGGVLCFASISDAPAPDVSLELLKRDLPFRVRVRSASELHDVELLVRRHNAAVGTLMGEAREIEIAEDGPAPRGPDFAFVSPRLHATDVDNFLFARPPLDAVYDGVFSPDLLDRRRASHYLVARFSDR